MNKTRKSTIEVFGGWKSVHNPNFNYGDFAVIMSFKPLEFDGFKNEASWISVEFLDTGENVNNPGFYPVEFDGIKSRVLAPKACFYPSLGQRPRNVNKTPVRAESPSH